MTLYHVCGRGDLERILAEGLRPRCETGLGNWDEHCYVDPDCVYLWPSEHAARAYARELEDHFPGFDGEIIEATVCDVALLPDQEALCRAWIDSEDHLELVRLFDELLEVSGVTPEELDYMEHADVAALIHTLPADLSARFADQMIAADNAVMMRGSIAPDALRSLGPVLAGDDSCSCATT